MAVKPAIQIWLVEDAPKDLLKKFKDVTGSIDWLAVIPKAYVDNDYVYGLMTDNQIFGAYSQQRINHPKIKGAKVIAGKHEHICSCDKKCCKE